MRSLLIFCALLVVCPKADGQVFVYQTTTTKATVYVPTTSNKTVTFNSAGMGASVYCSTASTATLSRDGSAPTATEESAVALNGSDTISAGDVKVFTSSNVGSGTTLKTYTVAAGEEKLIDLTMFGLTKGKSVTLATDNSCRMFFLGAVR